MAQSFTYNDLTNQNLNRQYPGALTSTSGDSRFTPQPAAAPQPLNGGGGWGTPGSSTGGAGIPSGSNAPSSNTGGGGIDWSGRSNQDAQIQSRIAQWAQTPGSNPSLKNDPAYWTRRIKETGGLGTDNEAYWQGLGMRPEGAAEGGSMQNGQWVSSGGGGQSGNSGYHTMSGGMNDPRSNQIFDLLMRRANQSLIQDPNDPIIRNQTDAYNAQNTRESRNYLAGVAERGGPNANVNAETRAASEKVGQLGGQFQAQLMQRELDARRQEIQSALSGAAGFLTQEQQMQLQEEMAALDRAQRESEFGRNYNQRGFEYDTQRQDRLGGF